MISHLQQDHQILNRANQHGDHSQAGHDHIHTSKLHNQINQQQAQLGSFINRIGWGWIRRLRQASNDKMKSIKLLALLLITFVVVFWISNSGHSLFVQTFNYKQNWEIETATTAELDEIINQMQTRPIMATTNSQAIRDKVQNRITNKSYLAFRLLLEPHNALYSRIQRHRYSRLYGIEQYMPEQPLCIVAPGRNLVAPASYASSLRSGPAQFLASIARQEYFNYRLIIADDASSDGTYDLLVSSLQGLPLLKQKTMLIRNQQRKYSLRNKDTMIRDYCKSGEIVIDIDADDQLIGSQVFRLVNTIYHRGKTVADKREDLWLVYFNNMDFDAKARQPLQGMSAAYTPKQFTNGRIRRGLFSIVNLRTFRHELYTAIPPSAFLQSPPAAPGQFHRYASDVFIYNSLLELAGFNHTSFVDEIVYYYNKESRLVDLPEKKRCQLEARLAVPFKQLGKLGDAAELVDGWEMRAEVRQEEIRKMDELYQNLKLRLGADEDFRSTSNLRVIRDHYINSQQQRVAMEETVRYMRITPHTLLSHEKNLQPQILAQNYFAFRLFSESTNIEYSLAQGFHYSQKSQKLPADPQYKQTPFCLVLYPNSTEGRQSYQGSIYRLLASISIQKYRNYKIYIAVDTQSHQQQSIVRYLNRQIPWMLRWVQFVQLSPTNTRHSHIFAYDRLIRQHCRPGDFVWPLNQGSVIVGPYTLAMFNEEVRRAGEQVIFIADTLRLLKNDIGYKAQLQPKLSSREQQIEVLNKQQLSPYLGFYFKKQTYEKTDRKIICPAQNYCLKENSNFLLLKLLSTVAPVLMIKRIATVSFLEQKHLTQQIIKTFNSQLRSTNKPA